MVVAAVSVYAIRGLYDIPPLLLAIAIGVMTAYLAIQFWRIFRVRDLRIQNISLKRNGSISKTGRWAMVILCAWFAFTIHSCFVQYHRYRGREHLNRVAATWPELLSGQLLQPFTPVDHANIDSALTSFRYSDEIGIKDVLEVKLGLAYLNMMNGDLDAAEKYLRQAYGCNPQAAREMLMEFLVFQNRQKEAEAIL